MVANALIKAGVRKGDKVVLWMFNSDLFIVSFYGIVKTGAVAVPVNLRLAPPEAEFIFNDCDAVAAVFDDVFEPAVRKMKGRLGKIKSFYSAGPGRFEGFGPLEEIIATGDIAEPGIVVDEFDESEIIYTSGTTGKPKGALFVHHNQMTVVTTVTALMGIKPSDRILHAAPLFHSAELNLYLNSGTYVGATHVVIKDFIPDKVLGLIEKKNHSVFWRADYVYLSDERS